MAAAMTNEQRFIASCESLGETDVRQKLGAGRFSDRRAEWASNWLEQVENGKSDATKAEEKSSRLRKSGKTHAYLLPSVAALVVLLLVGAVIVLKFG